MKVQFPSRLVLGTALLAFLSACGSSGISETPTTQAPQQNNFPDSGYVEYTGGDYAAYHNSFSTTGTNPTIATPALQTNSKLVVKINAEAATRIQPNGQYSNFVAEYNCAQFQVTLQMLINGQWQSLSSKVTGYLNVPGKSCSGGSASQTIDFSAYMSPGHGDTRIQVTSLKNDFYCLEYKKCQAIFQQYRYWPTNCYAYSNPANEPYFCPGKTVYSSHVINGSIEVQVNGTSFVN